MKVFYKIVMILILLCGCNTSLNESLTSELEMYYFNCVELLNSQFEFEKETDDFDIVHITNVLEDGTYRQDIILNNVLFDLIDVEVLVKVDDGDEIYYTSLGVLDEEIYTITNQDVDKDSFIYKGVNLSVITQYNTVKIEIMVRYYNIDTLEYKIERYFEIDNEIR